MSFPYVVLSTDGGEHHCETVGQAIAWIAENGGTVYEKLGLTTAREVCAEDLDPAAVARVVEAARKLRERMIACDKNGEFYAAEQVVLAVEALDA